MNRLLIASGNAHKVQEIRDTLSGYRGEVDSLKSLSPAVPEPEENGATFAENALIKALAYREVYSGWILADDSGIVVPELGGEPGIFSARYAGIGASDAENRVKLRGEIAARGGEPLPAYFVCSLSLLAPGEKEPIVVESQWQGKIIDEERGEKGFGYDAMFLLPEQGITAAELSEQDKNSQSHRGQALKELNAYFEGLE